MPDDRKEKLVHLGSEALAEALLDMAQYLDQVDDRINRMLSTTKENLSQYRKKLSTLKRATTFIDRRHSTELAESLFLLLDDLEACAPDPCLGVELVVAFYETDDSVFSRCDDSDGPIGEVYSCHAKNLFIRYASSCEDKDTIASHLMKLSMRDEYFVRSPLMDSAYLFLDESRIRSMIDTLLIIASEQQKEYEKYYYFRIIGSFAKQIKDAKLFEKIRLSLHGENPAACIEIAKVYLDCDEVEKALAWIQKVPEGASRYRSEYSSVLTAIYTKQGNTEGLSAILKRKFRDFPTMGTFQELLNVVGEDAKEALVDEEIEHILHDMMLKLYYLEFILTYGKVADAETYLFARADKIAGNRYETLEHCAMIFEEKQSFLATSLIFRGLLDAILEKGYTKSYPHGVRYLQKLDNLDPLVSDWKAFPDHASYKDSLLEIHGKKRSFWGQYAK